VKNQKSCTFADIFNPFMGKNIKWLKDNGIIRHVGPAKGGRWEVIGK